MRDEKQRDRQVLKEHSSDLLSDMTHEEFQVWFHEVREEIRKLCEDDPEVKIP